MCLAKIKETLLQPSGQKNLTRWPAGRPLRNEAWGLRERDTCRELGNKAKARACVLLVNGNKDCVGVLTRAACSGWVLHISAKRAAQHSPTCDLLSFRSAFYHVLCWLILFRRRSQHVSFPRADHFLAALPLYSLPCRGSSWFAPSCLDLARRPSFSSDAVLPCTPQSFFVGLRSLDPCCQAWRVLSVFGCTAHSCGGKSFSQ